MRLRLLCGVMVVLAVACAKADDKEADQKPVERPAGAERKSNIERVQMAVPPGKQVACADVFDPALFSKYIGDQIGEMKDKSGSNRESTVSCAFHRGGEPPKSDAQLRKFEKEGLKLGVLPGDEYCMVTAYCAIPPASAEDFKKSCEGRGDQVNNQVGQQACVHQTQRGVEYAFTYKVTDPETRCLLEVMGGPSVTNEQLVQSCTRAALENFAPDKLTRPVEPGTQAPSAPAAPAAGAPAPPAAPVEPATPTKK